MKYKIILFLIISLLLPPLLQALTVIPAHPQATLLSQDPDPVEPGQVVKVKFKIENEGAETKEEVIVKILPKFPFTVYNDVTEKNIGKLRGGKLGRTRLLLSLI